MNLNSDVHKGKKDIWRLNMKIYIVQVISNFNHLAIKISQEGFRTFDDARNWCRNKPGVKELDNGWMFIAEDCEYWIHDILVR